MPEYKIGIWGQYGGGGKIADGQAVRTTVITRELKQRYGEENILIADTHNWKKHPFKFFVKSCTLVAKSENILFLPAPNGFKVFAPILAAINTFYKRKLVYIVIGGFLPALLKSKPVFKGIVNRFDILFVQTVNLRKDLNEVGIKRPIEILSNLKRLNTRKKEDVLLRTETDFKVCTFSRITKEKGIEDAISAVQISNDRLGAQRFKLDIYGLLPDDYRHRFEELLKENASFVEYKGIASFDKTVETMTPYFALLFPTYYYGEGFPGNVVDAYNSALPIIATDWLYNKDVIKNGRNGILVPTQNPRALSDALLRLYHDRELAHRIALNNLEDSQLYAPDKVLASLYDFLDGDTTNEGEKNDFKS